MVRAPRKQAESSIYHVMIRGAGRQFIFYDNADRTRFLSILREALDSYEGVLICWCLMDNHVHLLLMVEFEELSRMMQTVESAYATYFNKRHDRVGHLFQGRFRSEPVDTESYLLSVVRYIHRNPVKEGLSPTCRYRWSSYQEYVDGPKDDALVSRDWLLSVFGSVTEFERFHSQDDRDAALHVGIEGGSRCLSPEQVREIADAVLDGVRVEDVPSLSRARRNAALRTLRAARLSVRQIERLTGVSRGIISRV